MRRAARPLLLAALFLAAARGSAGPAALGSAEALRAAYGERWEAAEAYLAGNAALIEAAAASFGVEPREAMAVAFPELLRGSGPREAAERAALRGLYVRRGKEGADFSTGPFQMKPSFAEALEAEFQKPGALPEGLARRFAYAAGLDGPELRLARLERLESLAWEAAYLCGFVKLLEGRFRLESLPPAERLRFLAAAYNAGFARSRESILASEAWAFFPPPEADFLAPRLRYADIAAAFLLERGSP